eukprot:363224-Chlamydomonas_euryale.AAC.2
MMGLCIRPGQRCFHRQPRQRRGIPAFKASQMPLQKQDVRHQANARMRLPSRPPLPHSAVTAELSVTPIGSPGQVSALAQR